MRIKKPTRGKPWSRKQAPRRDLNTPLRLETLEDRRLLAILDWSGDIPDGTVWSGNDVHRLTGTARVPPGSTLTIQPGAVVKFNSFNIGLTVEGTLQALGLPQQRIVFTEHRDDVGGDTNGDGNTSNPGPGNWSRILIAAGATANLDQTDIRYGGSQTLGQIVVDGGNLTLKNSSISRSSSDGIRINHSDPILTDNTYGNNVSAAISMDLSSNPAIDGVAVSGNGINGLQVDTGSLTKDGFWDDPDITYWLDHDTTVPAGMKLTVDAGQVVKFSHFAVDLFVDGTLDARGTSNAPIVFTENRDDTAGGDTNGDGATSNPGRGNWGNIRLTGENNVFEHVHVRYGGSAALGQLTIDGGELAATNSRFTDSSSDGVRIQNADPTLTNSEYRNNAGSAVSMDLSSDPTIQGVTLSGNVLNALQVDAGVLTKNGNWDDPDIVYWLDHDTTVPAGKTLTVKAGQVVKFSHFAVDLLVEGTLDARGTSTSPIIFTESRDDSAGGDTNGDSAASNPGRGNWGHILLKGTNNIFEHVQVWYGGHAALGEVVIDGGQLTATNSRFTESSSDGVRIQNANPTLTNNEYRNNTSAAISMDLSSNPTILGVTMSGNVLNALQVDSGNLTKNGFWDDPDIAYWLDHDTTVPAGMTLAVGAGQVIKFSHFAVDLFVNGTLDARGTAASPIIFTESRDDTGGGDTNGDAAASSPGRGNWGAIHLTGLNNVLEHVQLRYGGHAALGELVVDGGQLSATNSRFSESTSDGVRIQNANPTLTNNEYRNNTSAALSMDLSSDPTIQGVTMSGNVLNALQVDSGTLTKDSFWDDPDIAYWLDHDTTVPAGMTLTVGAGQVIKFSHFAVDLFVDGVLSAHGAPTSPIIFTESRDDSAGGDTNNDGSASAPGRGNWGRVELNGIGHQLEDVHFRFGGSGSSGTLQIRGETEVTRTRVEHSSSSGIVVDNEARAKIANAVIASNSGHGLHVQNNASVALINSTLDGNFRGAVVDGRGSELNVVNAIVTNSIASGIQAANRAVATVRFTNVFGSGVPEGNYHGLPNPTGTDGNVSVDPLYVNRSANDFHLQAGSPMIDAGTSEDTPANDSELRWRQDDPALPNTGAGSSPFVDLGAFERGDRFRQVTHSPNGEVSRFVDQVLFTFRTARNTASFSTTDDIVSFVGPAGAITISSFRWRNPFQLEVTFPLQSATGNYALQLGTQILNPAGDAIDQDGDGIRGETTDDQYTATWTITPPRVVQHAPRGFVTGIIDRFTFTFDRPMNAQSFSLSEDVISLRGPNGPLTATTFAWTNDRTLEVTIAPQTQLGLYEMELGSQIQDVGQNFLDQDRDLIPGEAIGDRYRATFTLADILFVSGAVTQNTTWSGIVIVEDSVTVNTGVTLTIQAGTVVKFSDLTGITVNAGATLNSRGTVAQPVRFTSIHDDSVGGDSDANGDRISPEAGDWTTIHIAGGTAQFESTHILFGGASPTGTWNLTAMIRATGEATVGISRSVLRDAFFDGVLVQGGTTTITNSILTGADRGVVSWLSGANIQIVNSTFDDNRIGLLGHGGILNVVNSIVSNSLQFGIDNDIDPDPTIRFSNIHTPAGTNTRGFPNPIPGNGNVSINPRFIDAVRGNYRLDFLSPMIDAADGSVATTTDIVGSPRYDDPRVSNTGVARQDGSFADVGAFEFVEGASSDIDLVLTAVEAPAQAAAGTDITIQWTGRNVGTATAEGTWSDAVYLSEDSTWSVDDAFLGEFPQTGNLEQQNSYLAVGTVQLPFVLPGEYFLVVRANSNLAVFEGTNISNNSTAAATATFVQLDLPELTIGGVVNGSFSSQDRARYYVLHTPEVTQLGSDLVVTFNDLDDQGLNELYIARGRLPTPTDYDSRAAAQGADLRAQIYHAGLDTYYVYALGASLANAVSNYEVRVSEVPFGVSAFVPTSGGNAGSVTLEVTGAHLSLDSIVRLVASESDAIVQGNVVAVEDTVAYATFDLRDLVPGDYFLEVENTYITQGNVTYDFTVQSARSTQKFRVEPGGQANIDVDLVVPSAIRRGRSFEFALQFSNRGNIDALAPLFVIEGPADADFTGPDDTTASSGSLLVLGASSSGPAGILRPGQVESIRLFATVPTGPGADLPLTVSVASPSNDAIPFADLLAGVGFDSGSSDAAKIIAHLQQEFGTTWNQLLTSLAERATENQAANESRPVHSVREILLDAVSEGWLFVGAAPTAGSGESSATEGEGNQPAPPAPPGLDCSPEKIEEYRSQLLQWVAAIGGAGGTEPAGLLLDYMNGVGGTREFGPDSRIARDILESNTGNSRSFHNVNSVARFEARQEIIRQLLNGSSSVNGFAIEGAPTVSFYDSSGHSSPIGGIVDTVQILATNRDFFRLQLTFGGTQGIQIQVKNIDIKFVDGPNGTKLAAYRADIEYVISDRYEFDNNDADLGGPDGLGNRLLRCGVAKTILTSARVVTTINGNVNLSTKKPTPLPKPPNVDASVFKNVRIVGSFDPNDKVGPQGGGPQQHILLESPLHYTVYFENDPVFASAPAQRVIVTDQLDSDLDWRTFSFGEFAFGTDRAVAPSGLQQYSTHVDTKNPDGTPLRVNIDAAVDLETGIVTWIFDSVDPSTGLAPLDPFAGFLPVDDATGRGEGHVTYQIRPLQSLASNTEIRNGASIVFDINDPILTPTTLHIVDIGTPSSQVAALPSTSNTTFQVTWSGTDDTGIAGIATYDVFVSDDGGAFTLFQNNTTATSAQFAGVDGHTYRFFSVATDHVGHIEDQPLTHDAETKVVGKPWQNSLNNRDSTNDGLVVPQDVLVIINEINGRVFSDPVTGKLNDRTSEARFFYDVNGDGFATPNDALNVINFLNAQAGEGENASSVTWTLDAPGGASDSTPDLSREPIREESVGSDAPSGFAYPQTIARQWVFADSAEFAWDLSEEETKSDYWHAFFEQASCDRCR